MSSPATWLDSTSPAFKDYLSGRRLEEIECIIPDFVGTSRGKAMPSYKFKPQLEIALPISIFYQTISGEYVEMDIENQWLEFDVVLTPDMNTVSAVPWSDDPTAQVICDMSYRDGQPLDISPRAVLKKVMGLYAEHGWKPVVAPELEFFLTKPNLDPNEPVAPPVGRSGRPWMNRQVYSMAAVDEYGPVIDTIYEFAEHQGLKIDTVIQEGGAGQMEINLQHGDPLDLADQVFYFKRSIKEAALKHDMYATFMAKPMKEQPGSAMHLHQSVVDLQAGQNIFSRADGSPTDEFNHFIAGQQTYLMQVMPLLAPYVNSYRRFTGESEAAPTNLEWDTDNRTTGIRVPFSPPEARRVENRVIGMDCNPYLAIAGSLACGLLGIRNKLAPTKPAGIAVEESELELYKSLSEALDAFEDAADIRALLGENFCQVYGDVKREENNEYQREITPWERQYLLQNA